nr:cytochrome P450 93A3-like [Tanacetum cinerariifolium]
MGDDDKDGDVQSRRNREPETARLIDEVWPVDRIEAVNTKPVDVVPMKTHNRELWRMRDKAEFGKDDGHPLKKEYRHSRPCTLTGTLEWALAQLINHPDIMKKAKEEIDQVVVRKRLLQESDIPNLPCLQAIEGNVTPQLHPTSPVIPRKSRQDCNVLGYDILANTHVFIIMLAINKDPNHWENPLEFRPERLENNMVNVRGQQFHFLTVVTEGGWKDGNLTSVDMEEGTGLTLPRANLL